MATIVPYQQNQRLAPIAGQTQRAPSVGFDDGVGDSIRRAAGGVSKLAEGVAQLQAKEDEASVNELDGLFADRVRQIQTDYLATNGKDALLKKPDADKAWTQAQDEFLGAAQGERQRGMLSGIIANRRTAWVDQSDRHQVAQTEVYWDSAETGRIASLGNDAETMADGPDRLVVLEAQAQAIRDRFARKGLDSEAADTAILEAQTVVHRNTVGAMLEAYKPKEAAAYLQTYGANISTPVLTQLRSVVREQVDNFDARNFSLGVDFGTAGKPVEASVDALWSALTSQESGGKQFTSSGQLLTSPVGAFGVAQLMPDTARDIARQMGDPSLAAKARTDPAVNERMGRFYLGQQISKYGNASLALAAYNAGPGRVDRWLLTIGDPRTGAITEAEWAARIPFEETRQYVANIVSKSGGAQALAGVMPEGQALAIARQAAGDDPRRQAAFEAAVTGRRRVVEADTNDARRISREAVQAYLPNGSTPVTAWTEIPPSVWNSLDPEYQNQIRGAFAADAAGAAKIKTDEEIYGALVRLKATNPAQLANMDVETYASALGQEDFRRVQGWILDARSDPDGNETPRGRAWKAAYDQVEVFAKSAGIETKPDKQNDDDRARMNALQTYVGQQVDAYVQANDGRQPTTQEVAGWAAFGLRTTRNSERRGNVAAQALLGSDNSGQYGFEQGIGETVVPGAARSTIVQEFRRAGRAYDDTTIRQAYEYGLRSGRFAPTR